MKGSRGFLALFVFPIAIVGWVIVPDASAAAISACGGWTQVRAPDVHVLDDISAASSSDVWAVGWAIEHWDGSAWTVVPNPQPSATLFAVTTLSSSDAWAVGTDNDAPQTQRAVVEHWAGSAWNVITLPSQPGSFAVLEDVSTSSSSDGWAVGSSVAQDSSTRTLTYHWDGVQWTLVPSPNVGKIDRLLGVVSLSPSDVWAVGSFEGRSLIVHPLVEHWDGSAWSIVKLPGQVGGMYLTRVTGSSSSDVWAVGSIRSGEGTMPVAEHWDGTVWSATPTIGGAGQTNVFNDVLESSLNDVWAVGDSATLTLAEHWDGSAWSIVPSANPGDLSDSLSGVGGVPGGDLWAVGFDKTSSPRGDHSLIERCSG